MSSRPDRSTTAGNAYLDLRKLADETKRPTDELHQLYALEGFLDRLIRSHHRDLFVLKGGVLLAAYADRRPTRDIDFAASQLRADEQTLTGITNDVLSIEVDDGLNFDQAQTRAETIREDNDYAGIRIKIGGSLATAKLRFHIDVNVGDPLWPDPQTVELPRLLDTTPLKINGYTAELILAEKIVTAIQRGTANTRWRDFVDIASLAETKIDTDVLIEAIERVAHHRQTQVQPLAEMLDGYAQIGQQRWAAWRRKHQLTETPEDFAILLNAVIAFSDPLLGRQR